MTTSSTNRLTEAICPSWCAGHRDEYQAWEERLDSRTPERDHADRGTVIGGVSVSLLQTEVPDGMLTPRVVVAGDTEGMHELTEDQAHDLGLALVRAADRLRRMRMEGQR